MEEPWQNYDQLKFQTEFRMENCYCFVVAMVLVVVIIVFEMIVIAELVKF